MKIGAGIGLCMASLSLSSAAKATLGTWQFHNTGWWDVAWSPNTGPVNPQPTIVCGVFNPVPGSTPGDLQCMDTGTDQVPLGFTKSTGRDAAHLAVALGGFFVADTKGELWYGNGSGPVTPKTLLAGSIRMTWSDQGPLPGGCSCPSTSVYPTPPNCAGQLAMDDQSILYVLGCDGAVYMRKDTDIGVVPSQFVNISANAETVGFNVSSIGYSLWHRQLFAMGTVPDALTTSNWVTGQGWTQFSWASTSNKPAVPGGADLQSCFGILGNSACWLTMGGAHAVIWNRASHSLPDDSDTSFLGFDEFQGTKTSPLPSDANNYGKVNGWDEYEQQLDPSNYSISPYYPVIYRIMEGGTGITSSSGVTDVAWVVTNINRLLSYEIAIPPYEVVPAGHPQPFGWATIAIPQTGCPPICTKPVMNFLGVGAIGTLFARALANGSSSAPVAITTTKFAPASAAVLAVQESATQGDVFVAGNDETVYEASVANNGPWSAPVARTAANFVPAGAALATARVAGALNIFTIDLHGVLEVVRKDPVLGWLSPAALTSANYAPPGAPLATGTRAGGEVDVFSVGTDGSLKYMAAATTGFWSGPWVLSVGGFAPPGAPVATALDVHGYLNVFTIGNDGALYTKWDATPLWAGPTALTAAGVAPPGGVVAAINANNSSLNAFFVDNTSSIVGLSNAGFSWQGPTVIGAHMAAPGAATSVALEGTSQLDVFVVGTGLAASGVLESVNSGGGWSVPVELP